MPKNIVILCDGTSNAISANRTNILRLYGTLTKSDRQLVYYDPGVGTFGADNAWSYYYRKAHEIWGLATGWGLDHNVKEAYRFLVDHFDDGERAGGPDVEPDRIYLFGFSRGAYTARVLAGFLHAVGLIRPANLNLLDYAYRAYKGIGDTEGLEDAENDGQAFAEVRLYERILRPRRPVIRCLGLFDTVGSVVEWGRFGPRFQYHAFTKTNRSVEAVRHAVAIDERRTMFRPQLWPEGGDYWSQRFVKASARPQDVREVWFSGVHGDVGGGAEEESSQLAKIPLDWLIKETRLLGLNYSTQTINRIVLGTGADGRYVAPDALAAKGESMNWAWRILECLPRRVPSHGCSERPSFMGWYLPLCERRWIAPGAKIHDSVLQRRGTRSDDDQPGIPENVEMVSSPET
ncbi:MAG: DUF2235 domain-containing protein [Rhizobiales bacterium]|nr:DUF2235 domain-containing protein [Hyphomicrobiales bacterium]